MQAQIKDFIDRQGLQQRASGLSFSQQSNGSTKEMLIRSLSNTGSMDYRLDPSTAIRDNAAQLQAQVCPWLGETAGKRGAEEIIHCHIRKGRISPMEQDLEKADSLKHANLWRILPNVANVEETR